MKTLLAASLFAFALASPALAQSTGTTTPSSDAGIVRSGAEAVGDASILPGGAVGNDAAAGTVGNGTATGSGGTVDGGTTRSVTPGVSIPNATLPNVNRPGTGIDGAVTPRSSGGIPNSLNGSGSGVPGSTSTGPASGGSSAF